MTVKEFFISKFQKLSISLPEAQLNLVLASGGFQGTENFDITTQEKADKAFLQNVGDILLMPDFSEGDLSIKFDRKAIQKWYAAECLRLGLPNYLELGSNEVKDLSYLA